MKHWRIVGMVNLAVALAIASPAPSCAEAAGQPPNGVAELREWLSQRNKERKKLGLAVPESPKKRFTASSRLLRPTPAKPPEAAAPEATAATGQGTPVLHISRGPDGRVHVRYIVKDEAPDQLQVYTPSGYIEPPAEEPAKLERLTPRGKRAWLAGSSLRNPSSYRTHVRKRR